MTGEAIAAPQQSVPPDKARERFLGNVLWNWLGVIVTLVSGFVLSPVVIRKLGHEAFGIWALAFSIIEYYWLLDLGLRRATAKYTAQYSATGENEKINELVNTGLVYFSAISGLVLIATFFLAQNAYKFLNVSAGYRRDFSFLILVIGVSWALGAVLNVFTACFEGFQRFDLLNQSWILATGIRVMGCLALLLLGFGLLEMGIMLIAAQAIGYVVTYLNFRKAFPECRISFSLARFRMLRQLAGYGVHAFVAVIATQLLAQSVPILIGYFLPVAFVGYFVMASRLLNYSGNLVENVGMVTSSKAAELQARGDHSQLAQLNVYSNRYCVALFLPMGIWFLLFGRDLIRVWIGEEFAAASAPLLPSLLLAKVIVSGQYNSISLLYGLGKHGAYSRGLLAEALLSAAGVFYVLPQYGIWGAAWVTSIFLILNRGVFTSILVSRELNEPVLPHMASIYLRPLATGLPAFALALWIERRFGSQGWAGLFVTAVLVACSYYGLALFTCLRKQDRALLLSWAARRARPFLRSVPV
jgi:O-antigen/teichoic acid export membrane protein